MNKEPRQLRIGVLGEDAHFYKLQVEGFADTVLHRTPMQGAAIRALVAISRAAETGEPVRLVDATGGV